MLLVAGDVDALASALGGADATRATTADARAPVTVVAALPAVVGIIVEIGAIVTALRKAIGARAVARDADLAAVAFVVAAPAVDWIARCVGTVVRALNGGVGALVQTRPATADLAAAARVAAVTAVVGVRLEADALGTALRRPGGAPSNAVAGHALLGGVA